MLLQKMFQPHSGDLVVSLAESRVKKDLLYAGTDDGVIAVTEDGGKNWTRIYNFPGYS